MKLFVDFHENEVQKTASSQSVDNWFAVNQPNRKMTTNVSDNKNKRSLLQILNVILTM